MSTAPAVQAPVRLFPYEKWGSPLPALARQYRENQPCPHILLKDFLDPEVALEMAKQFPAGNQRGLDAVQARQRKQAGHAEARDVSRRRSGRSPTN